MSQSELSNLIWSVADLLRGDYRQSEYGRVILAFTVLRRLDCVLAPTKEAVLDIKEKMVAQDLPPDNFMLRTLCYVGRCLSVKCRTLLWANMHAFSCPVSVS